MDARTPAERQLAAQIAAYSRWSRQDTVAGTAAARRGFLLRFERQVDPDGVLSDEERAVRAARALRAHMQRLALASAKARRARRASP